MYTEDKNNSNITFTYKVSDLFNNCSTKVAYKSRHATDNEILNDEITLTDDDKSVFIANLPSIMADIYDRTLKLSSGINSAFSVKTDSTEDDKNLITIKLQYNGSYNNNTLTLVDASLYQCIELGCIKAWYDVCGIAAIEGDYTAKYKVALMELSRRIFQLKKKTIKSTLGTSAS